MSNYIADSFLIYTKDIEFIDRLTDDEAGQLMKNIMHFHSDGNLKKLSGWTDAIFAMEVEYFKKNAEKREKQRLNGLKGGRPRKSRLLADDKQKKDSASVTASDSVTVSETHRASPQNGGGVCLHPTEAEIMDYCKRKNFDLGVDTFTGKKFIGYYRDKGQSIGHSWTSLLDEWIARNSEAKGSSTEEESKHNEILEKLAKERID